MPGSWTSSRWLVGFVAALCFVAGCVGQATKHTARANSVAQAKYRIAGTVVDAGSGEVIADAMVTIGNSQSVDTLASVRTGEDGDFRFDGVDRGKYWLRAEAKGFSQQGFDEHQGFFTGIVTGGMVDSEHLKFRLHPDASIMGEILDDANEPVRDGQVLLFRRQLQDGREVTSWFSTATINDEGHYRFSHLQPGAYFVAVRTRPWYAQNQPQVRVSNVAGSVANEETQGAEDGGNNEIEADVGTVLAGMAQDQLSNTERALDVAYPVTFYPGATEESSASALELKAGDRVAADFRLTAVPAIHARIVVAGTPPGEGVHVNVMQKMFDAPEQPVQGQVIVGERGETEISGIAPGDYEVEVQTFGKNPMSWRQQVSLAGDSEVTLNPVKPASAAIVKGVMKVDGAGAVPKGAFVHLLDRRTGGRFTSPVSEKGEFDFSSQQVVPGKYEVLTASATGGRVSRIAASGARVEGLNVEIGDAGNVQLTITMGRGFGTVNGIALRGETPMAGAMVVLVPQDLKNNLPLVRRDQSDLDGTFTLGGVVPGRYTVVAIQDGWELDWTNPQLLGGYLKNGRSVTVVADEKYEVRVGVE